MGGNPPDFHLLLMTGTRELRNEWKGWATTLIGRSASWKLQLFVMLSLRSRRSAAAQNLFLHRQPALMQRAGIEPGRIAPATGVSLAVLAKLCNWRQALIVSRPGTLVRWHGA